MVLSYLGLMARPDALFTAATGAVKRRLLGAFFSASGSTTAHTARMSPASFNRSSPTSATPPSTAPASSPTQKAPEMTPALQIPNS